MVPTLHGVRAEKNLEGDDWRIAASERE